MKVFHLQQQELRGKLFNIPHVNTPKPVDTDSKFDVSSILGPTPRKTPQHASVNQTTFGDLHQTTFMSPSRAMDMTEDITTTNVALLLEEDPGLSASQGLYQEFMQCMRTNPSDSQTFDLVYEYEYICREQLTLLNKLVSRARKPEPKNTWQLIRSLFRDRLETEIQEESADEDKMNVDDAPVLERSEKEIADKLITTDARLIVDWLESCAQESVENFSEKVKFFSDRAVAWENTLHRLQNRDGGVIFGGDRPLVDEMDPDAPFRQNKMLDDLDKEDESRLLQYLFVCLRAGQLEKAQEICQKCGQSWRAATLEGWRLHHDPNYTDRGEDGQILPIEGNPNRDIWKNVCWVMASEPRYDMYEKAIYGILSGNSRAIIPVCRSWSDYLWAYYKVLVDIWIEQEIRARKIADRTMENLPTEYWEQPIEACENLRLESQEWLHVLQKWIILGDVDKVMEVMGQWIREEPQKLPQHLLRFMCHFVLFLQSTQHRIREDLCNLILEAYIIIKISLLTMYLNYPHIYKYLDVQEITKRVVENIKNRTSYEFSRDADVNIDTSISEEDRKKIEAIDWLVFDVTQRAEAMKQANAVMRIFVAVKKLTAAKEVFDKIPRDSIDVIYKIWHSKDAMESFNDWFSLYHHNQPSKPTLLQGATFTEKVAHEHRMKKYQQEIDRWQSNLILQTKTTKGKIYNVLLFTDGGWMTKTENRQQQMALLRQLVLPGLCFLLHNILHSTQQFSECMQLADCVASEQHALYKVFRKDEIQKLLKLLRDSSLAVLNLNRDPLGFTLD
ncbi:hypothetical protein KUTeg_005337 [Tegillarca granosa]|uniref:Nuclear pore complex protein n=1 Tax=Tegillarca granosa TaxID=220873 RepID=A0ABQ9FJF0_TEGGR|nr:hypothetical protein KUTeg_005337 [Tegillarca granosa]